jgi:hypothetical protein
LDMLAAAATSSPDASEVVAHDSDSPAVARPAAAAAAGASHPRGRARAGSSGSGSLHDHDYDTDGTDGGAYVCEGEDPQDSDDQERQSNKNRSTKERVLSNRLAASRSYQRRKEEMVRLEHNHARLQVRGTLAGSNADMWRYKGCLETAQSAAASGIANCLHCLLPSASVLLFCMRLITEAPCGRLHL